MFVDTWNLAHGVKLCLDSVSVIPVIKSGLKTEILDNVGSQFWISERMLCFLCIFCICFICHSKKYSENVIPVVKWTWDWDLGDVGSQFWISERIPCFLCIFVYALCHSKNILRTYIGVWNNLLSQLGQKKFLIIDMPLDLSFVMEFPRNNRMLPTWGIMYTLLWAITAQLPAVYQVNVNLLGQAASILACI